MSNHVRIELISSWKCEQGDRVISNELHGCPLSYIAFLTVTNVTLGAVHLR